MNWRSTGEHCAHSPDVGVELMREIATLHPTTNTLMFTACIARRKEKEFMSRAQHTQTLRHDQLQRGHIHCSVVLPTLCHGGDTERVSRHNAHSIGAGCMEMQCMLLQVTEECTLSLALRSVAARKSS